MGYEVLRSYWLLCYMLDAYIYERVLERHLFSIVTRVTGPPSPKQKKSEIFARVTRNQKISWLTSIGWSLVGASTKMKIVYTFCGF